MPTGSAGQVLGEIIGSLFNRDGNQAAYQDQLNRNYRTQQLMERARQERNIRIAGEAQTPEAIRAANPNLSIEQATILSNAARAQRTPNMNTLGMSANDFTRRNYVNAAAPAIIGELGEGQGNLVLADEKPIKTTQISGGTAYNPYLSPDQDGMQTTPAEELRVASRAQTQRYSADQRRAASENNQAARLASRGGNVTTEDTRDDAARRVVDDVIAGARESGINVDGVTPESIRLQIANTGKVVIGGRQIGKFDAATRRLISRYHAPVAAPLGEGAGTDSTQPRPIAAPASVTRMPPPAPRPAPKPRPSVVFVGSEGLPDTATRLPKEALAMLRANPEGIPVEFNNGQVWTMANGRPYRVR